MSMCRMYWDAGRANCHHQCILDFGHTRSHFCVCGATLEDK